MNIAVRDQIKAIVKKLGTLKSEVEDLAGDEREKFDNMSEGLQASEKGQAIEQAADQLDAAVDKIQEAIYELDGVE